MTYIEFHLVGNSICESLETNATAFLISECILDGVLFEVNAVIDSCSNIGHWILLTSHLVSESSPPLVKFISKSLIRKRILLTFSFVSARLQIVLSPS